MKFIGIPIKSIELMSKTRQRKNGINIGNKNFFLIGIDYEIEAQSYNPDFKQVNQSLYHHGGVKSGLSSDKGKGILNNNNDEEQDDEEQDDEEQDDEENGDNLDYSELEFVGDQFLDDSDLDMINKRQYIVLPKSQASLATLGAEFIRGSYSKNGDDINIYFVGYSKSESELYNELYQMCTRYYKALTQLCPFKVEKTELTQKPITRRKPRGNPNEPPNSKDAIKITPAKSYFQRMNALKDQFRHLVEYPCLTLSVKEEGRREKDQLTSYMVYLDIPILSPSVYQQFNTAQFMDVFAILEDMSDYM